MEFPESDLTDLRAALDVIESASKLPARSRTTNVGPFIDDVTEHAYQSGLHAAELQRVVNVLVIKNELDQTSRTTLLRNLIPASRLPSSVVLVIVGALGQGSGKPTPATQALFIRWIAAIHDVLEEPGFLLRLYGVLFNLLDLISIRTPLCQLLGLITRRKHVKPFRIQRLLTLCQQFANEQALVGLLRVYKNFCPEIIISQNVGGRPPQSPFDSEWRTRLIAIQDIASQMTMDNSGIASGFKINRNGTRKSKASAIPEVQSYHAEETSVTLEEVNTVTDFVGSLERIEPPSQLVAGLRDPLLQKFMALRSSPDSSLRLEFWLERYFEEEIELLQEGFGLSTSLPEILKGIISYTEASKELNHVVEKFLMAYLPLWDGSSNLGLLLDLLSHIPPRKFEELYQSLLSPLERAILQGAHSPFEALFDFYSKLIHRWIEYAASQQSINRNERQELNKCLAEIQNHISTLILSALVASDSAAPSVVTYLDRISIATTTALKRNPSSTVLPIIVPEIPAFYLLLLSSSLSTVSRLCAILKRYYTSISESQRSYSTAVTSTINTYLMDTCNLLYRARAFVTTDKNSAGCLCPPTTLDALQLYLPTLDREYSLASMFCCSWHALVSSAAHDAFREMEREAAGEDLDVWHSGPVGQRSLVILANEGGVNVSWKEYRIKVLQWLSERGLGGLEEFLFATIKDLSK